MSEITGYERIQDIRYWLTDIIEANMADHDTYREARDGKGQTATLERIATVLTIADDLNIRAQLAHHLQAPNQSTPATDQGVKA